MNSESRRPGAIDPMSVEVETGTSYPPPFDELVGGRLRRRLGDAFGLTQFGVNLILLPPGAASSQRHWHTDEDEFVYILQGIATLVADEGSQRVEPGMVVGFPAGVETAHPLVNESDADVVFLEVGTRAMNDTCRYGEADLLGARVDGRPRRFTRRDGSAFGE
jgi:uncharacterized cupin superfamily protein